jgi:hypothetical protein
MSRIHPQKIAPAFLAAQTHSLLQQPVRGQNPVG